MPDAKIIVAIEDMSRAELTALFVDVGAIFSCSERTECLRRYVRSEYRAGRLHSYQILTHYDGGL